MDSMAIIRRSWEILRRYKVLWLFGILVAFTGGGNAVTYSFNRGDFNRAPITNVPWREVPWARLPWLADTWRSGSLAAFLALCCCLLLILIIAVVIVRYVSRAALIRSVDQIDATGAAPTWREGFRLGWTNRTLRLWLFELIVGLIVGLAALLLLALAASPLLLLLTQSDAGRVIGITLTVLLGLGVVLLLIVAGILLSVLGEFWSREILLRNRGFGDALVEGYAHVRGRIRDVGLMWLLLFAIGIGFAIVMIPIVLIVIVLAGLLGGGLGWLIYQLTNSTGWAVALGVPVGLLVFAVPLALISGLYTVFTHNAWTLTYREVIARLLPSAPVMDADR